MLGIHDFELFVAAGILLNVTPGQDTLYIVGRTLAQGRAIGVAAALGICTGALLHTFAAALGVSAIVATSATAFLLLKIAGGMYLVYLGARLLVRDSRVQAFGLRPGGSDVRSAFRQGVITNVSNPKVALFFLAFLPQFIDPYSPHKIAAFIVLGCTFVATSTVWCLVLALIASRMSRLLGPDSRSAAWPARLLGATFIALGLRLLLAER